MNWLLKSGGIFEEKGGLDWIQKRWRDFFLDRFIFLIFLVVVILDKMISLGGVFLKEGRRLIRRRKRNIEFRKMIFCLFVLIWIFDVMICFSDSCVCLFSRENNIEKIQRKTFFLFLYKVLYLIFFFWLWLLFSNYSFFSYVLSVSLHFFVGFSFFIYIVGRKKIVNFSFSFFFDAWFSFSLWSFFFYILLIL